MLAISNAHLLRKDKIHYSQNFPKSRNNLNTGTNDQYKSFQTLWRGYYHGGGIIAWNGHSKKNQ